jgi:tetratricopeptide (TPR) repeat protein
MKMKRKTRRTKKNIKHHQASLRGNRKEKKDKEKLRKPTRRPDSRRQTRGKITGWRLWLFRIIAFTIIPALLFLLLEIALRTVGYGFAPTATVKCKIHPVRERNSLTAFSNGVNGTDSYCSNAKFAWRFFPPNIARQAHPFAFPADKSNNTYRIFVMGASAAAGTPDGAFCFGRILQVMLHRQYPEAHFEVITTAMPAINSHVVLDITKDCAHHQPDLFVVYMGNNEVVGPYGAGTVFTPLSTSLSFIRFDMALKATRIGQMLTNLLGFVSPQKNVPKVWRGLEMFLDKQIRAEDSRLETVYRHFRRNLEDISFFANKSNAKTIFCTVGSNLKDSPPFASLHRPDLTEAERKNWDNIYQQGVECESAGDYAGALQQYLATAEIDDSYADLQFRIGRCFGTMREYKKAKERFILARDLDTLRFRADTRINQVIRDIAENKTNDGVYLVDTISVFEKNSPYETPGEELFYEHVHMNFTGNYLLAEAIFKQVEKILPERINRYKTEQQFPTKAECARYLAYTDWDRYKIAGEVLNGYIKQAPFTNQLYHNQRVTQMEQKLNTLKVRLSPEVLNEAQAKYRWAIEQNPSDWWLHWKYGELLEELGSSNAAAEQYRLVLNIVPYRYEAYAKLGLLAGKQGNMDAAITQNLEAIRVNPIYADAHFNLGLAYQFQDRFDRAVEHYTKAIKSKPDYAQAYNNLAVVLFQQGKIDEAIKTYRNGLKLVPDDLDLHYNLGLMLEQQGHRDEAIKELRTALRIDPNSVKTRNALGAILKISSK